jgi:DNA polymerase III epsilon subunit-like protein
MVVEGDSVIEKNDLFIEWPDLEVSEGAAKITGFTEKEYNKRCEPPKQVWDKFSKELYNPENLIIGQNLLGFDVYMVNIWRRLMNLSADYSFIPRILDTKALATAIAKEMPVVKDDFIGWQYRLLNYRERGLKTSQATLLKKYNIDHDPKRLHDALYDIEMNFKVFRKQLFDLEI